jgi:hypothetical protein
MIYGPFILFAIATVCFVAWVYFGGGDPPDSFGHCHP